MTRAPMEGRLAGQAQSFAVQFPVNMHLGQLAGPSPGLELGLPAVLLTNSHQSQRGGTEEDDRTEGITQRD